MKRGKKKTKTGEKLKKLPAYSRYPAEGAPLNEHHAFELIKMFAGAIEALNGGVLPMPSHWRGLLEDILELGKPGLPPDPKVKQRKVALTKEFIEMRIQQSKEGKRPFMKHIKGDLGAKYKSKNIYRDIKGHEGDAIAAIVSERLNKENEEEFSAKVEWAKSVNDRCLNGESLEDISFDPKTSGDEYTAIRRHKEKGIPLEGHKPTELTDIEKVIQWISFGSGKVIPPGYPRYMTNPHKEVIDAARTLRKPNKK